MGSRGEQRRVHILRRTYRAEGARGGRARGGHGGGGRAEESRRRALGGRLAKSGHEGTGSMCEENSAGLVIGTDCYFTLRTVTAHTRGRRRAARRWAGVRRACSCVQRGRRGILRSPARWRLRCLKRCRLLFLFPIRTGEWHGRSCCCRREDGRDGRPVLRPAVYIPPFPRARTPPRLLPHPPTAPTLIEQVQAYRIPRKYPRPTPTSRYTYSLHPTFIHSPYLPLITSSKPFFNPADHLVPSRNV